MNGRWPPDCEHTEAPSKEGVAKVSGKGAHYGAMDDIQDDDGIGGLDGKDGKAAVLVGPSSVGIDAPCDLIASWISALIAELPSVPTTCWYS